MVKVYYSKEVLDKESVDAYYKNMPNKFMEFVSKADFDRAISLLKETAAAVSNHGKEIAISCDSEDYLSDRKAIYLNSLRALKSKTEEFLEECK